MFIGRSETFTGSQMGADMVIELRDARFPEASRNPMLLELAQNKPRLIVLAKSDMASIVDSLVAPLSLINALLVALCMEREDEVTKTLTDMEQLWAEYQVYSRDDIDPAETAGQNGI